ncbi:hypothetical protein [Labilibaculum euxinus]
MESIEIILKNDAVGNPIELDNMSLSTTKSVREILDALINIAEYEKDLNLKIGLKKGSAAHRLIGNSPDLEVVYNKFVEVAENKPSRDNHYVNQLNIIYKNFQTISNYDIFYEKKSHKENIKPLFLKKFKNIRNKEDIENKFRIEFLRGTLKLNGGENPNFHITSNKISYTIQCSKTEAQKINPFLYNEVYISAWVKETKDKNIYYLCDIYSGASIEQYDDFKFFFATLKNKTGTEPFHFISNKLEEFYNNKELIKANNFIKIFLTKNSLVTYLRTILVISKAFKEDEVLKSTLLEVEQLLSAKIGKVY